MCSKLFNKLATLTITCILSIMQSCSGVLGFGYQIKDNKVFYDDWRSGSPVSYELPGNPDIDTFKDLGQFAKDKNHVWFNENLIDKADPKTFEVINKTYSRDKQYVFLRSSIIEGADPNTFELTKFDGIAKDKNHVFYNEFAIPQAIPKSFMVLDDKHYAKDDAHVFYKPEPKASHTKFDISDYNLLETADATTFSIKIGAEVKFGAYDNNLVSDKIHVFHNGEILEGLNPEITQKMSGYYFDNKTIAYYADLYESTKLDCQQANFKLISSKFPYATDGKIVFFKEKAMPDADPNTIEVLDDNIAKDKNHVYWSDTIIPNVDMATFKYDQKLGRLYDKRGEFNVKGRLDELSPMAKKEFSHHHNDCFTSVNFYILHAFLKQEIAKNPIYKFEDYDIFIKENERSILFTKNGVLQATIVDAGMTVIAMPNSKTTKEKMIEETEKIFCKLIEKTKR